MSILVVDDHKMFSEGLALVLRHGLPEHEIMLADTVSEGLQIVESDPNVELILLDLRMPGLDGMSFLDRLQASPLLREIPVVILSGQDTSESRIAALERGAVDVLTKPFNPMELELRIRRYLPTQIAS